MVEATEKEILEWLCTKMRGSVTVHTDGSREPQIEWHFSSIPSYYGPSPPEALRNAYEADKHRTTREK